MKTVWKHLLLILVLCAGAIGINAVQAQQQNHPKKKTPSHRSQKTVQAKPALDQIIEAPTSEFIQASDQLATTWMDEYFQDCASINVTILVFRHTKLSASFNEYILEKPSKFWAKFPVEGSSFVLMAQILLPELLPINYPFRDAFTICSERHRQFRSGKPEDRKELLMHLSACYEDAYRVMRPELIDRILGCYKDLKD